MTPLTLTTDRLTLRAPVMADFPAYASFWASARSVGMGGPVATQAAWAWFCHDVALWTLAGYGGFMLVRRSDDIVVGEVSLNTGPLFPEVELGWFLHDGFEGQGYISEAATAAREWAFRVPRLPTLVSYVDPANPAAARVARRLGAVIDPGAPRMQGRNDDVWRHPHPGGTA